MNVNRKAGGFGLVFIVSVLVLLFVSWNFIGRLHHDILVSIAFKAKVPGICHLSLGYSEDHIDYSYDFSRSEAVEICKAQYYGRMDDEEYCERLSEGHAKSRCYYDLQYK